MRHDTEVNGKRGGEPAALHLPEESAAAA